jgi:hypothetical protein
METSGEIEPGWVGVMYNGQKAFVSDKYGDIE